MKVKIEFEVELPDVEHTEEQLEEYLRYHFRDNGSVSILSQFSGRLNGRTINYAHRSTCTIKLNRMIRQELELKAKEFDSKLKRHPMSSEELQKVLCDFVEVLRIHDVVGLSEQLKPKEQICYKSNEPCKYDCSGLCKESF